MAEGKARRVKRKRSKRTGNDGDRERAYHAVAVNGDKGPAGVSETLIDPF